MKQSGILLTGKLVATIESPNIDCALVKGMDIVHRSEGLIVAERGNAFVNTGLNIVLDRIFSLSGPPAAVSHIGVSADTAAVTAASTLLDPAGAPTGISIKALSPAASRASQVVTAGATFTQADVTFVISKVGLLNTSGDAGTGLFDVIGGSGVSPYNQPFTIDLTGTSSFSLLIQIQVTAAAI